MNAKKENRDQIDEFILDNYKTMTHKAISEKFEVTPGYINNRMISLRMAGKIEKKTKHADRIETPEPEPEVKHGPEGTFEVKYSVEGVQSKQKVKANSSGDAMKRYKAHLEKKNPDYIVEIYSAKRIYEEEKTEVKIELPKVEVQKAEAPKELHEIIAEAVESLAEKEEVKEVITHEEDKPIPYTLTDKAEKKEVEIMEEAIINKEEDSVFINEIQEVIDNDILTTEPDDDFYTAYDSKKRLHIGINGNILILDPAHTTEAISYITTLKRSC